MQTVTLYTKENCSLCDTVKAMLNELSSELPHTLAEVDITKDDALFAKYRYLIPVVQLEEKTIQAPITEKSLRKLLTNSS